MNNKLTLSLKKKKLSSYSLESLTTTARKVEAIRFLGRTAIGNFGQDQKKKKKMTGTKHLRFYKIFYISY